MTKEDLRNALSLSCVENYFLAFFKDKLDIRQLYVESFVSTHKVLNDFLINNANYENYSLVRVQDTAEKLGLVAHKMCNDFKEEKNALNLIRVNEKFFDGAKLMPWRADHFIAVECGDGLTKFWNNYPLSSGELTACRLREIYDKAMLIYWLKNELCCKKYNHLANLQFKSIMQDVPQRFILPIHKIVPLRNAILVLKTLRKRLVKWLEYMGERGEFLIDIAFINFTYNWINCYEKLFVTVELQIARQKIDIIILQGKVDELMTLERELIKEVSFRRLKDEHI